jgi:hypothetical protein
MTDLHNWWHKALVEINDQIHNLKRFKKLADFIEKIRIYMISNPKIKKYEYLYLKIAISL